MTGRQFYLCGMLMIGASLFASGRFSAPAEEADQRDIEFFEARIRPVLVKYCYECHSATSAKIKGSLLLDSRDGLRRGGSSGPALVPGRPDESLLIQALNHQGLNMPPREKLPEEVIADLTYWVKIGAPDPRTETTKTAKDSLSEKGQELWSLRPIQRPSVPRTGNWARSDIDRFILAGLEAKGLKPVADAEPHVLLRRLHYVLIGLPPTPQQVERFQEAASRDRQAAIEQVVDELLASRHFGERWARHWLDLARYADVNGTTAPSAYPEAWRYREYVIHAFNSDKPFDRFVREQLAGDLLPAASPEERAANLVATGYLALFHIIAADRDPEKRKLDVIDEQLDVLGKNFLGISLGCARCHDHKLDPVPTRDYYSLAGIFRSTSNVKGGFGSIDPGSVSLGKMPADAPVWLRGDNVKVMGAQDEKSPRDEPIHYRGEVENRGEVVPRGFPTLVRMKDPPRIPAGQSGRMQLAEWLLSAENPLVWRVIVNRIWHHVFGQGLVRSTDNFGTTGDAPSHPELLDYLALRFREQHRGAFKSFIKELLLTRAWQLSAHADASAVAVDPDNRLLGRANRRRQDAEALHDSLLFVAGRLDVDPPTYTVPAAFKGTGNQGSTVNLTIPEGTLRKRAVYWPVFRKDVPVALDMLSIFDMPVATWPRGTRAVSIVPSQVLFLLNSPMILANAETLAAMLLEDADLTDTARLDQLYLRLFARKPSGEERERALRFLVAFSDRIQKNGTRADDAQRAGWSRLCHTLLIANEFLVVE
ncbi:MAG: PSD1 and planctomycete cytochrome C domain-containing protein [Gemmataceae bacterium]